MRTVALGDHVEILSGFAFKSERFNDEGRGLPLVRIRDVKPAVSQTYYEGEFDSRFLLTNGDLLVGMDGEFNCARWAGGNALLNQRVCRVRAISKFLDEQYLFWFLPKALKDIEQKSNFVTVKHLSTKQINEIEIPLPPLEEQKRIAAILDQADELRRKRQRALDRLNQLGQAIFVEMFGDFDGGSAQVARLGALTSKIGSGATPKGGDSAYKTEGTPLIRSMNVRDGEFSEKGLVFLDDQQATKLNNVIIQANDVLLNITGASVARVCLAPPHMEGARVNQHVSIIRPSKSITSEFLEAFLLIPRTKRILLTIAEAGATRQAITKAQIEELEVPVPELSRQRKFIERLRLARQSTVAMVSQSTALEAMFASLQHRAFRGEL